MNTSSNRARCTAAGLIGAVALLAACSAPATSAASAGSAAPQGDTATTEVAAAQDVVDEALTPPDTINQTVPLSGAVPSGTYVVITCELPQCKTISDGAIEAAQAIGWETQTLSYATTDGATLTTAMQDALQYDPIAVSPIGFSQDLWDQLQPQYKAAGVPIVPIAVGDVVTSDVVTEGSSAGPDYAASGAIMANWVTVDSGAAAHVLVQDVPAFAVLAAYGDGFRSELSAVCSACEVTDLDVAPAQLATNGLVPAIVSALQKDPSIDYLVTTDGAFLSGLPSALAAAGITTVKVAGGAPDINNMEALVSGTNAAWTAEPTDQFGWVAVDIAARTVLGMDVEPTGGGRPQWLVTPENVGTPANFLPYPADYRDQYRTLWGLA